MKKLINTAVIGSTGYVGIELIKILSNHPGITIKYLISDSHFGDKINKFDNEINNFNLPTLDKLENINFDEIDVVFLALPHSISHPFVKNNFNKSIIIDLSADFRLDNVEVYNQNYKDQHSCPELLNNFVYGLAEINHSSIKSAKNISVPGCYPTSILLPLIPLIKSNLIQSNDIIIDSKSGYSGAGKKFDIRNLFFNDQINFYNYNTNNHRHICEIKQELSKFTKLDVNISFNPHILPIFRGMMSTIYCNLSNNISHKDISECLIKFYSNNQFVNIVKKDEKIDFFRINKSNNCYIKLFNHYTSSKIIIVSLIDNLIKGASGQAIQCMNIACGFDESLGLDNL